MKTVEEVCAAVFPTTKLACNFFLRAVTKELSLPLQGIQADDQVDYMSRFWTPIGVTEAIRQAGKWFVAAGLDSQSYLENRKPVHGHVAVVVPGPLYQGKHPKIWCGSLIPQYRSHGNLTVGQVWSRTDRDIVNYFLAPMVPVMLQHSHG